MSMMRFHILFPDVAEKECRAITLSNHESLPDRTFLFVATGNQLASRGGNRFAFPP